MLVSAVASVKIAAEARTSEEIMGFDPALVNDWWSEVYTPVLEEHAAVVFENAKAKVADERPELMETCEKGQLCRDDVDEWINIEVRNAWETVLTTLKSQVESTKLMTIASVEESWDKKVKCEQDFPCCEYSTQFMTNVKIQIVTNRAAHLAFYEKWSMAEEHRKSLVDTCPGAPYQVCSL